MRALRNRVVPEDLPVWSLWPVELASRFGAAALSRLSRNGPRVYDWVFTSHDAAVSILPWGDADTIYAYEDGALRTFERAAKLGLRRIYDLPTPHFASVETMHRREAARWNVSLTSFIEPQWKRLRKSRELALADEVVVASNHTHDSLLEADFAGKVHVVPYGFPVEQFAERQNPPRDKFTVLAVGSQSVRKGTIYLLEAWRAAALQDAQLILVGRLDVPTELLIRAGSSVQHIPHVARSDLSDWYARADVLAFPTLADGFGLVIQEAMCVGVPVITTRCGGGPECITHGEDGFIVDAGSVDALVEALRFGVNNRDTLAHMGRAARATSERYTGARAGERLRASLNSG